MDKVKLIRVDAFPNPRYTLFSRWAGCRDSTEFSLFATQVDFGSGQGRFLQQVELEGNRCFKFDYRELLTGTEMAVSY